MRVKFCPLAGSMAPKTETEKENEVDMEEDELTMVELKRDAHTHMDHIETEYDYPSIHTELGVLVLA